MRWCAGDQFSFRIHHHAWKRIAARTIGDTDGVVIACRSRLNGGGDGVLVVLKSSPCHTSTVK